MKNNKKKIWTKEVLKYYFNHFWTSKWLLLTLFFISAFTTILSLTFPIFVREFIDLVTSAWDISLVIWDLWIIFYKIMTLFIFIFFSWRVIDFSIMFFEPKMWVRIYKECFSYLHKHSYDFFVNNFSWALLKKVGRLASWAEMLADIFIFELIKAIVSVIFIFWVLFYLNTILWIFFLIWAVVFLWVLLFLNKWRMKFTYWYYEEDSKLLWYFSDTITNNFNISIFSSLKKEFKNFSKQTSSFEKAWKRHYIWITINFSILAFMIISFEILIIYVSINFLEMWTITVWTFVLLQMYLFRISEILITLSFTARRFFDTIANSAEMLEILQISHEIQDIKWAKNLELKKWEIEFKNVNFSYKDWISVFKNFNLKIKPWEKIALVWTSWAWKSSIVKLLFRFFDIQKWEILIDNQNISKITQESLRKNISLVPQDSILFHRSLRENIAYWKENVSEEEILEVSKKAHCHNFISKLPDWYNSMVWERWVKLSWWERQRIAIARALLENWKIFIFDEATSALDSESEKLIQKALDLAMNWKTSIIVAHRLSTIMKADRIIVLENWEIKEQWKHSELLKKEKWIYKKLWKIQSWGFI